MKHSINELFDIIYQYHPRGQWSDLPGYGQWPTLVHPPTKMSPENHLMLPPGSWPPFGYDDTDEQLLLVATRLRAAADMEKWLLMLRRLRARLPERVVESRSLHLPTGKMDSCYAGWLDLPVRDPKEHHYGINFLASFLVPYYVVYSEASSVLEDETGNLIPCNTVDFFPNEKPYVPAILEELGATFEGYEPMPPEIGNIVVPEAVTYFQLMGKATIYDCLFLPIVLPGITVLADPKTIPLGHSPR